MPEALAKTLEEDGILIKPYQEISAFLEQLEEEQKILFDRRSISIQLFKKIPDKAAIAGTNLVLAEKAIKNEVEIEHIRSAMVKDGVALTRLYRWLHATLETQGPTEFELSEKLAGFRAEQPDYFGESFAAIVGYRGNGAIVHYRPMPDTAATIQKEGLLLLDSGGQYLDGTTDITRTISLGTPTEEENAIIP